MNDLPAAAKLRLGTKLAFSVGNVGLQMLVASMSFFLLIFYTDVALVAPAIAGTALLIGKAWDAFYYPLFGWIADRTRSRHGRRRVYLIYGAAPLALVSAALWVMPAGLSPLAAFIWIAIAYTLWDTILTMVQMPYAAMGAELVRDYDERTSLMAISSVGVVIGYILGSVAMPLIVRAGSDAQAGYALAGGIFGLIAGASVAIVAWRVPEPQLSQTGALSAALWAPLFATLRNRPFVFLLVAFGLVRLGLTVVTSTLAYFVVYQLGEGREGMPKLLLTLLVVVGVFIVFWKWVADKWEKNIAYSAGLLLSAFALCAMFWLQPGQIGVTLGLMVVIGIGMSAHWVVPYAMLPDVVDQGEVQSGERRTGIYYGVYGLADKIARTLGTVAVGWILQIFGYVPNVAQSAESLLGIRLAVGPIPAACILLAIPLLLVYPINRAWHARICKELEARSPNAQPADRQV